jgi:predicted AAA+ superfamily ATPase
MKNYIQRAYDIDKIVQPGKVLVLCGPRRSGKTTLLKQYTEKLSVPFLLDSGDNTNTQEILGSVNTERILARVEGVAVYILDEAQNIPNIGQSLKIMIDARPDLIVIATGSSSFDLANKIGEPLVGRREIISLYPFALQELSKNFPRHTVEDKLDSILIYGLYPQVYTADTNFEKESRLQEIVEGYLLKDIFALEQIKAPTKLLHLVKLLAQYIGQPISVTKLASEVGLNQKTIERYLDLLEKTFVVRKVIPFSNKLSQSLKFKPKYYFYDLGVRNALLGNFLSPNERIDIGSLWENFCYIERIKKNAYDRASHPQYYFYQSYVNGKEIDIIEEYNGYTAFECKWKSDKKTIAFEDWDREYPESPVVVITRDNYWQFLQ